MIGQRIIDSYAEAADSRFIGRYEAIDPAAVYAPVAACLPREPAHVLDIGAGTGRDAAWLAARGHRVVAVEPAGPLRQAAQELHSHPSLTVLDDRLPTLDRAVLRAPYDWVIACAVWQHIDDRERADASMLVPGGMFILSLRHGPGNVNRPVFCVDPERTLADARAAGLSLRHRARAAAVQEGNRRLGVSWTWLVLEDGS